MTWFLNLNTKWTAEVHSYLCRTNSSVTTFFTSPNSSCFSLQRFCSITLNKANRNNREHVKSRHVVMWRSAAWRCRLTRDQHGVSSEYSRWGLRQKTQAEVFSHDVLCSHVSHTLLIDNVMDNMIGWEVSLTLSDGASFHEDNTEDHKEQPCLWTAGGAAHTRTAHVVNRHLWWSKFR